MEQTQKNSLLLQVADLSIKKLQNGNLSAEQEAQVNEILKKLGMSFEEAIKAAKKLLMRS